MNNTIIIQTPRLILRSPEIGDAKPLNDAINRSLLELQRWQPWAQDPSLSTTEKFITDCIQKCNKQENLQLIVIHRADDKIIAATGYNDKSNPRVPYYEIGYWLETSYTGQGLATELANALTRYAFEELNAVRVQIVAQSENTKSINVAKRCGYEHEATLKKVQLDEVSKKPVDDMIFTRFDLNNLPELEVIWFNSK